MFLRSLLFIHRFQLQDYSNGDGDERDKTSQIVKPGDFILTVSYGILEILQLRANGESDFSYLGPKPYFCWFYICRLIS